MTNFINQFSEWKEKSVLYGIPIFLLLILLLKNYSMITGNVVPYHDTMAMYQGFHVFYNHYFYFQELPYWMPYSFYGLQSSLYFHIYTAPCFYFIGLMGALFNIDNTLFLFSLGLLLEEAIFISGIFLLGKHFFKNKSTVLFVCVVVTLSGIYIQAPYHTIQTYYCVPLVLYFMLRYFEDIKFYYLLVAANIFILSLLGTTGYTAPIQFLPVFVTIVTCILFYSYRWKSYLHFLKIFRSFRSKIRINREYSKRETNEKHLRVHIICEFDLLNFWKKKTFWFWEKKTFWLNLILFSSLAILLWSYWALIQDVMNYSYSIAPGRDRETSMTPINHFLSWGRFPDRWDFIDLFKPNLYSKTVYTLYTGLFTIGFGIISLFIAKPSRLRPFYYSCLFFLVLITFFSLGERTPVAAFMYYLYPGMKYYRHVGYTIGFLVFFIPLLSGVTFDRFIEKLKIKGRCLTALLVSTVMFITFWQLSMYQKKVQMIAYGYTQVALKEPSIKEDLFSTHKPRFLNRRTSTPENLRAPHYQVLRKWPGSLVYGILYSYLGWDPSFPIYRIDHMNSFLANLMAIKLQDPGGDGRKSPAFLKIIGENTGKVRLLDNVRYASIPIEEISLLDQNQPVILIDRVMPQEDLPPLQNKWKEADIHISSFTFNRLDLEVHLSGKNPAWLFYADTWHPRWKAMNNGNKVHVFRAYRAFKAILVQPGVNHVSFFYEYRRIKRAMHLLVIMSILWILLGVLIPVLHLAKNEIPSLTRRIDQ